MALKVDGETISDERIREEVDRLRGDYKRFARGRGEEPDETQLLEWARENMIEHVLLTHEARHLELTEDDRREGEDEARRDQRRLSLLFGNITGGVAPPSAKDIAAHYEEHRNEFVLPERVHASHIVRHEPDDEKYVAMLNLRERLRKGASFEHLAGRDSDCPDRAGDLGTFTRGQMVPEFEKVVFAMAPGEISEVFETPFGYHIAKVHARYPAGPSALQEVKDDIARRLLEQRRQDAVAAFVDKLKAKATIETDV